MDGRQLVELVPAARFSSPVPRSALSSQVRPGIVLPECDIRTLLDAATRASISRGGCFSAGSAGIQLWSIPPARPERSGDDRLLAGRHLGSVDWSYGTPARHYATIYRCMVTAIGAEAGETTESILATILDLGVTHAGSATRA